MVTAPYTSLESMEFRFNLVMGLLPASHYYQSLVDTYWKGLEHRNKYSGCNKSDNESYESETMTSIVTNPKSNEPETDPGIPIYTVQTLGAVKRSGNTCYCPVKDTESGSQYNLCFTAKYLTNMRDRWQKFQERSADGVKLRIYRTIQNQNIQFINIA